MHNDQARNTERSVSFLRGLRPNGPWLLSAFDAKSGAMSSQTFNGKGEIPAMTKWIDARIGKLNLYYVPNPTRKRLHKKPKESDMAYYCFAHVDADPKTDETPEEARKRHRAAFATFDPPPTITYVSGNGMVALWKLASPIRLETEKDIQACKAINKAIIDKLGGKAEGYDNCQSLDHLLRLPHTLNIPDARKIAAGRVPIMSGEVVNTGVIYGDWELPLGTPAKAAKSAAIGDAITTDDVEQLPISDRLKTIIREGRIEGETKTGDNSPSGWRFELIQGLMDNKIEDDVILGLLMDERYETSKRGAGKLLTEDYARKEIERAHAKRIERPKPEDEFKDDLFDRTSKKRPRFKGMSMAELRTLPPLNYLLDQILPVKSLFEVYGPRKAGKTFFALDAGLSIATGTSFHGIEVRQGRVLHIVAEGNLAAVRDRVEAWTMWRAISPAHKKELETAIQNNWRLVGVPVHIDVDATLKEFLKTNPEDRDLIIADTLMRNMAGHISDPKDMAAFVRGCDAIRETTGAAVLIIHHEGKDKTKGGMGSMVLDAAVDGIAKFYRNGNKRIFSIVVLRDADDSMPDLIFELESVPLQVCMGDDGQKDVRSAVLKLVGRKPKKGEWTAAEKLLRAIHEGGATNQTDLAVVLGVTKQAISKTVTELREKGYLPETGLNLTARGVEAAETIADPDDE